MRVQKNDSPFGRPAASADHQLRAIGYSMGALIPGLYIWFGPMRLRWRGSLPEDTYPGTIHSPAGFALVLPNYRIYSTYQGNYDRRC